MIATIESEMLREVMEATGLPEDIAREIVAIEMGRSPGDVILNEQADAQFRPENPAFVSDFAVSSS